MSYPIPDDSPWRAAAVRVGQELRKALEARNVGWRELNRALGKDVHSIIDRYKAGRNLPRLAQAALLAEALEWPALLELVRDARTFVCPIDGRTFVCDTGHRAKFCSPRCRDVDGKNRGRMNTYATQERQAYAMEDPERVLVARIKQELERARQVEVGNGGGGGYVRRREVRDAIKQWEATSSQSRHRRTRNQLNEHLASVEQFCRSCEPDGICRTEECPLRAVSPLPFKPLTRVELAEPKDPRAGWADPEKAERRRESASGKMREWWASMTPAERVAHIAKVQGGRRAPPGRRSCGCPMRGHIDPCPLRRARQPVALSTLGGGTDG